MLMKPLQVYLEDDQLESLDRWSRARGWTKSQAVRVAIRALTRPRGEDPLLAASGMIDGLPEDLSEHFERHLKETFVAESSPAHGSRKRSKPSLRR